MAPNMRRMRASRLSTRVVDTAASSSSLLCVMSKSHGPGIFAQAVFLPALAYHRDHVRRHEHFARPGARVSFFREFACSIDSHLVADTTYGRRVIEQIGRPFTKNHVAAGVHI